MTPDLTPLIDNGVLGAITAFLLYRNRQLEMDLRDALQDAAEAMQAQARATTGLTEWLKGVFSRGDQGGDSS